MGMSFPFFFGGESSRLTNNGSDNEVIGGSCLGKLPQVGTFSVNSRPTERQNMCLDGGYQGGWLVKIFQTCDFHFFKNLFDFFVKSFNQHLGWQNFTTCRYWIHSTWRLVNVVKPRLIFLMNDSSPSFFRWQLCGVRIRRKVFRGFQFGRKRPGRLSWTKPWDFSARFFTKMTLSALRSAWEYSLHTMWCDVHLGQPLLKSHLGCDSSPMGTVEPVESLGRFRVSAVRKNLLFMDTIIPPPAPVDEVNISCFDHPNCLCTPFTYSNRFYVWIKRNK